jgi:hypothetical protein
MEESVTYQAIVEKGLHKGLQEGVQKGRAEEARRMVLLVGEERFQRPADRTVRSRLEEIDDIAQLEELIRRTLHVGSWDELLPGRRPSPSSRRRKKS